MATEYGDPITPPSIYWTLQDELALNPGEWDDVENVRFYTEGEAEAVAQQRARDNLIRCRVVRHY